jgi:hypothetical protein
VSGIHAMVGTHVVMVVEGIQKYMEEGFQMAMV